MADIISYEQFCNVLEELFTKKKKKPEQERVLSDFLHEIKLQIKSLGKKECSMYPVLRLLLPDLERERSAYNLKETKLGALLVKVLSLPKSSPDANKLLNFRSVKNTAEGSDLASVAYFVLNKRLGQTSSKLTVGDINDNLDKISAAETGNKGPILDETFTYVIKNATAKQAKWFLRIVLKDLKLGMGKTRILSSLHPDAPELYEKCSSLTKICEELDDGNARPLDMGIELFSAVSPMLSERLDITRIADYVRLDQLYHIEEKFDGERFQVHMKDGVYEYFSRKGFSYVEKYGKTYESDGLLTPLLKNCFKPGVTSFVLDGEMMGWHKQYERFSSKGMSFDVKKLTENSKHRPCFCAFDILYYNGISLVGGPDKGGMPLTERLAILDEMFTDVPGVIQHSRRVVVRNNTEVLEALNQAMENEEEGIVLKDCNSHYIANRRNAGWYKIKPEYTKGTMDDLDLVVIGADYAENKSQGLARSFFVACSEGEPGSTRWFAVGRVATGLSFEERERVCKVLSAHWKQRSEVPVPHCLVFNKEAPDLWIMPEHSVVFTVRATELIRSSHFGTEYTLRFPRVLCVREDKPVSDVMTLQEFNALVANRGPVIKLSSKRINEDEMESFSRKQRKPKVKMPQLADIFQSKHETVQVTSSALLGRRICVLSDDDDCSKPELENIVQSHQGIVVQNFSPSTWLCVFGRMTVKVRNAIKSQQANIISTSWLRALPLSDQPCPAPPCIDFITLTDATRMSLARNFDSYGDSYTDDIDKQTIKKLFTKMDYNVVPVTHLTKREMLKLDRELFEGNNPISFLRVCYIHMRDASCRLASVAQFYGATLCSLDHALLTHVVLPKETTKEEVDSMKRRVSAMVLSEEWLEACVRIKEFIHPAHDYVL